MELELSTEEIEEIKQIASYVRNDIGSNAITVFVNQHNQIVIEQQIENCETMYSIKNIMTELNRVREAYLQEFDSNFEMWMNRQNPVIYCTYERVKTN